MEGRLRNMASLYITSNDKMLLLYRIGSRVVAPSWCGIGGHFEKEELNDAKAAILREVSEEIGITEEDLMNLRLRYITLRYKNQEIRQNYYFFAELKEGVKVQEHCLITGNGSSLMSISFVISLEHWTIRNHFRRWQHLLVSSLSS